jgi:ribosomal subunit interface protein
MSFPTINYKFNGLAEAQALTDIVEQKCATLEKYLGGSEFVICEIEFEKVAPRQNGQIHRMEANITVDGNLFRAEATEESFEEAIDEVRDELDKALRRAKEKHETLNKQAGREAKEQILGVKL